MGDITPRKSSPLVASLLLLAVAVTAAAQVRLERIASVVHGCVDIQSPRDGSGRLFFVRQQGLILLWNNGVVADQPFLDIRSRVSSGGERGLLGLAFPPNYREKRWFYVNYTDRSGATVIARYNLVNDTTADAASERILLTIPQPFSNHNGGQIQFGPDGMLYIGMGDGGDANDPQGNGQNTRALLGKMLRLDTESNLARYEIPSDNPYVSNAAYRPEIWASGLRNPWRFSFDPTTGDLYIADVGQDRQEEINFQPRSSRGGENYGWATMEGTLCLRAGCNQSGLTLPVHTYPHSEGQSITGGYVWRGAYYYGDFVTGKMWALRRQGGSWVNELVYNGGSNFLISTFGLDESGNLYVANYGTGEVFRILPTTQPSFSARGVVSASSFTQPITPGGLTTIFTTNVLSSNTSLVAASLPLPRSLGGIELRVNNVAVPLLAIVRNGDSEQINFQMPWEFQPGSTARIEIVTPTARSAAVDVPLSAIAPGIFAINATDALLIDGATFSLVTSGVRRGDTLILYATGLGLMDLPVANGEALNQASRLRRTATLRIGSATAEVLYAGAAPGFVGVYQVNFRVPQNAPTGTQDLVLSIDGTDSPGRKVLISN
jgi:uncharacterized protein (TIGR03437 family)